MKLRTVLSRIQAPTIRPGQILVSGVTGQPGLSLVVFQAAPKYQKNLATALRWFSDEDTTIATRAVGNTIMAVFITKEPETAELAVVQAAKWLTLGLPCEVTDKTEMVLESEIYDLSIHDRQWPAVLKKLARNN